MTDKLVIVESPAKAKTIKKYLGKDYQVLASYGHIRDLPESLFGIDIKNNYQPMYELMPNKRETADRLKKAKQDATEIYLATDPDREGEAISYHLAHILGIDPTSKCRITFNEITKKAITDSIDAKRPIDSDMFNAQQARRVLDRIVGYKASPLLWKKIKKGLSAGRVQSVAVKLICDRENEINAFVPEEYWNLILKLSKINDDHVFLAKYYGIDNKKQRVDNEASANEIYEYVKNNIISVKSISKKQRKKYPNAPFITSTLQQDASNKLGFTTSRTMKVAQQLYEGLNIKGLGSIGLITYMRTDSTRVSSEFQLSSRDFIVSNFGNSYIPKNVTNYLKKGSKTQDAHEAIRPTDLSLTPTKIADNLTKEQLSLYSLIYNRFVASQMAPANIEYTNIDIVCGPYLFKSSGDRILFKGYLTVYEEHKPDVSDQDSEVYQNTYLPELSNKEQLLRRDIQKIQKFTKPPARYTEASLVKTMEEKGIGRPSTYAPTINVIMKRGYVKREKRILYPTDLGITVNNYLSENFADLVDYDFTAEMEEKLDEIESGKVDWVELIDRFYKDFMNRIETADKNTEKILLKTNEKCDLCGRTMVIKTGRYGDFLACSGYPECKNTKPITDDTGYLCPKCKGRVLNKKTKTGIKFLSCENYPDCDFSSWGTITGKMCPKCDNFLLRVYHDRKSVIKCSSESCGYTEKIVKTAKKDEKE